MRLLILTLCVLVALSVFAIMLLSIWSSRQGRTSARQGLVAELVWAAIPCLMIVAAAIPAVMAVAASGAGEPRAVGTSPEVPVKEPGAASAAAKLLDEPEQAHAGRGDS
jgi:heme/copper-type cytochrome/quinol oxidase subunit 2